MYERNIKGKEKNIGYKRKKICFLNIKILCKISILFRYFQYDIQYIIATKFDSSSSVEE